MIQKMSRIVVSFLLSLNACQTIPIREIVIIFRVQEITPVYTVVQPATVPLRPAKPNKIMILIGFVFLAGVGSIGWILLLKIY